jgi:hypothetical protein
MRLILTKIEIISNIIDFKKNIVIHLFDFTVFYTKKKLCKNLLKLQR